MSESKSSIEEQLIEAIKTGNEKQVRECISKGANPVFCESLNTPKGVSHGVHVAAHGAHAENPEAYIKLVTLSHATPLWWALTTHNPEMVKLLASTKSYSFNELKQQLEKAGDKDQELLGGIIASLVHEIADKDWKEQAKAMVTALTHISGFDLDDKIIIDHHNNAKIPGYTDTKQSIRSMLEHYATPDQDLYPRGKLSNLPKFKFNVGAHTLLELFNAATEHEKTKRPEM